ncbi:MAG: hypothetical protein ACRDRU_02885, partial [Pseudonocardiaceae bacterium]
PRSRPAPTPPYEQRSIREATRTPACARAPDASSGRSRRGPGGWCPSSSGMAAQAYLARPLARCT